MKIPLRLGVMAFVMIGAIEASRVAADSGRIAIFKPTTITAPGHYFVSRDIDTGGAALSVIVIAANDVVLDLNGHRLASPPGCAGDPHVIVVDTSAGAVNTTIRNGQLVGGCSGIFAGGFFRAHLRIENVDIRDGAGPGIEVNPAESVDVIDCHILHVQGEGIFIDGGTASFTGRILNNKIERVGSHGMRLNGLYAGQIRNNVVVDMPAGDHAGIFLTSGAAAWQSGGNLVEANEVDNTVALGAGGRYGIWVEPFSPGNYLLGNIVRRNSLRGILCRADVTRLESNVASLNLEEGIRIEGLYSHLDRNQAQGAFSAAAPGVQFFNCPTHAYSNNNFRNNPGGAVLEPVVGCNTNIGHNAL